MRNSEHYRDPTAGRAITRVMREAELEKMDSLRKKPVTLETVSEAQEQEAVMVWAKLNERKYPCLKWLFHIPNGGSRHPAEAVTLKRMGVKPGVPDLFLPCPRREYCGLWIEMKAEKGRLSALQGEWIQWLNEAGYRAVVCFGAQQAIDEIERYLNDKER